MNYEKLVKVLNEDAENLIKKRTTAIGRSNFSEAIGATKLLKETLVLIKDYDWIPLHSIYEARIDGEFVPVISLWEQNGEGICRNHRVWIRGDEIKVGKDCDLEGI